MAHATEDLELVGPLAIVIGVLRFVSAGTAALMLLLLGAHSLEVVSEVRFSDALDLLLLPMKKVEDVLRDSRLHSTLVAVEHELEKILQEYGDTMPDRGSLMSAAIVVFGLALSLACVIHIVRFWLKQPGVDRVTVSQIVVYPIKSCAGIPLTESEVGPRGFLYDRQWMIVQLVEDEPGCASFCTQRQDSRLATISPSLPQGPRDDLWISCSLPGAPSPIQVPVVEEGPEVPVRVWSSPAKGIDQGDAAAAWLVACLGKPRLRLLRMADRYVRPIKETYVEAVAPKPPGSARPLPVSNGFADGFPFLVASEASLYNLNRRLSHRATKNGVSPTAELPSVGRPAGFDVSAATHAGIVRVAGATNQALPSDAEVTAAMAAFGDVQRVRMSPSDARSFEVTLAGPKAALRALQTRVLPELPGPCTVLPAYLPPHTLPSLAPDVSGELQPETYWPHAGSVCIRRFRPNIVVKGAKAWAEDRWTQVQEPDGAFLADVIKPCDRCSMPTVDQVSGKKPDANEPSTTLRSFRTGAHLGYKAKWSKGWYFGQNLLHRKPGAQMRVGDVLVVRSRRAWHRLPRLWTEVSE